MTESITFRPDWLSAPGETIGDILRQQGISLDQFGQKIGSNSEQVRDLISGRLEITQDLAERLEVAIGASAAFWVNREKRYRAGLGELKRSMNSEESRAWVASLPYKEMSRLGWLPDLHSHEEKAAACLRFFGVGRVEVWKSEYSAVLTSAVFRTSEAFESKPGAVAAWLRQGEIESATIQCEPWDSRKLYEMLPLLRNLTREENPDVFIPKLREMLASCGIAVVVLRAPTGCRASGATKFLTENKALMLLSVRFLSDDQFWFSVFHETGHLLLHPHRLFVDAPKMPSSKEEDEANQFAAKSLVPEAYQAEMISLPVNGRAVMKFARKIGVAPGIVVGQLQHRGRLGRQQLNNLKRRYSWR